MILNGQDIIPVNPSWTVLLNNFIEQVNQYPDQPLEQEDLDRIVGQTVAATCKIFPKTPAKTIHDDLDKMLRALIDVAYGRKPETEIGYLSLGEYAPNMTAPHRMDLMVSAMTKDGHWHCNQKCLHCVPPARIHAPASISKVGCGTQRALATGRFGIGFGSMHSTS